MRRNILFVLSAFLPVQGAHAYDVLIPIGGQIADNGCNVSASSTQLTVPLGGVNTRQPDAVNNPIFRKPFVISLEQCGPAASGVVVTFQGIADEHDSQLLQLTQTAGGDPVATGLAIEIIGPDSQRVPINNPSSIAVIGPGTNALTFYAQHRTTGSLMTEGRADGVVTFQMEYQ